jgi:soluble lytic murein transglycosylase-like protein
MPDIQWSLGQTDPYAQQAKGYSYAEKIAQNAAGYRAGKQYAQGDLRGAAQTQAMAGDIPAAQATEKYGQDQVAAAYQYISRALPVFQAVAAQHANDPDGGSNALGAAFDHIAPEIAQVTGHNTQALMQFRQSLITDPKGTLARIQAALPAQYQNVDGTLLAVRGNDVQQIYQAPKFGNATFGSSLVPENAAAVDAVNGVGQQQPQGAPAPQPQQQAPQAQAAPSGQIIARADPAAMHAVESNNNPGAVSPAGAMGVSQVMPATAAQPGFGVTPARDNSPAELQRVGDETLAAYTQHYGNAALGHIAYNWGPGNTDKWLASGGQFSKLPKETQDYLGRIAVAQAIPQGQGQQGGQARIGQPLNGGAPPVDRDAIKNDVRIWLASKGTINPQYGMGAQGAALRQEFDSQKNALMKDLKVTPEDVASGQAIRKADTQSLVALQKQADNIKAFEGTASKNADLALSLLDKGGPQGQAPIINKWTQEWRKWVAGDKNVSQYTLALGTFADEYAKVVAGQNGATDSVRAEAYSRINAAMNKDTIRAVIGTMKQEMANRSAANDEQIGTIKQRLGTPGAGGGSNSGGKVLRIDINGKPIP